MASSWLDLLGAAVGGAGFLKLAELGLAEYRRGSDIARGAKESVQKHLDPILKAADDLVGRIRSLSNKDFQEVKHWQPTASLDLTDYVEIGGLLYLVAQFWARIQILRLETVYLNIAKDRTGRRINAFLYTLESGRIRLVGRAWQRGIGECLIQESTAGPRLITFNAFLERYVSDSKVREWFAPLLNLLIQTNHTRQRQRVLVYGAVLHAFTDTLDRKHLTTRDRRGWPNKLSRRSRRELEQDVFKLHLNFVKKPERYCRVGGSNSGRRGKKKRPPNFGLAATRPLGAVSQVNAAVKPDVESSPPVP